MNDREPLLRHTGSPSAADPAPVPVPGKQTLPIQRFGPPLDPNPIAPAEIQVDQYAPGTDARRHNDCGPSCVLMALRSIDPALEDKLKQLIDPKDPGSVTLQAELNKLRALGGFSTDSNGIDIFQVRTILQSTLATLGRAISDKELDAVLPILGGTPGITKAGDQSGPDRGKIEQFIHMHTGDGSAIILRGNPNAASWGWGGTQDPNRRTGADGKPEGGLTPGAHFIYVWRSDVTKDVYIVMDPSWSAPKPDITLEQVLAFAYGFLGGAIRAMAVPFTLIAQRKAGPRGPGGDHAETERTLPAATRHKMERLLFRDFSTVRVLEGTAAPATGALAFARGEELHFAPGQFRPGTPDGDRLIAHELAHVVQQRQGRVGGTGVVDDRALEAEADHHGERAASSDAIPELEVIATNARGLADQVLAAGAGALVAPIRAQLAQAAARVRELTAHADEVTLAAGTRANDAIVAAYQALAVSCADATSAAYAAASPGTRDQIVGGIRKGSHGGAADDYCGEFVKAQYASAGLVADFTSIFNHVDNVLAFFTYNAEAPTPRVFDVIDDGGWQPVRAYHAARGSTRTIQRTSEVRAAQAAGALDQVMRPGDVATLYMGGADPSHADHTVMVRRVWGDGFESIEGNAFVTLANGHAAHGIGTNTWNPSGADLARDQPQSPRHATVFLVGRPSVVDFEAGHTYANTRRA